MNRKLRLWVTGKDMAKNLVFHIMQKEIIKSMKYIDKNYKWEMVIVYDRKVEREVKRYYNYNNKKTFPQSILEF